MIISIHTLVKRVTNEKLCSYVYKNISIHTLVKRVTLSHLCMCLYRGISIHTLVKRVTLFNQVVISLIIHFNSHSRKESDLNKKIGWS